MAGLTSTGFEAKSFDEMRTEVEDDLHAEIDPGLNVSETSVLGQFVDTTLVQLRAVWEALQAVYAQRDPSQAEDAALEALSEITGTTREAATYSTMPVSVTLAAGTYAAGSLIVHLPGAPEDLFDNDEEVVSAGGVEAGVAFTALNTGPIQVPATTLALSSPPAGFTAAVADEAASPGADVESIPALRIRRETELRRQGSTAVDAIAVDVADVDGTSYVTVYENDTLSTVDGIPGKAIEVVVLGGTDAALGAAILGAKAAGIQAYGSTTVNVQDALGNTHVIGFTRPTSVPIYLDLAITAKTGVYAGDDAVRDAITAWTDVNLGVGVDVLKARIESLVMSVAGVIDVVAKIGDAYPATSATNYVVDARERAVVSDGDDGSDPYIDITTTLVTAAP